KTGVDSTLYAVGLKDEVKGTGVFGSFELKREGGKADQISPEVVNAASTGLFISFAAALCYAVIAAGL
ncbi:MAG: hypothetical protein SGPRY_011992, partial [Prymnesium sp.]